jgi:hypothetical protein
MNELRRSAIAALAAATVTIGSLAMVPTASAMPSDCYQRIELYFTYLAVGNTFYGIGAYQQAAYWWGKADGIVVGC